ncbi:MAG: hypothetical protein KatS3mg057_3032 [Herpetosiphonaceae bacterium]|nr:MAG: hypothetical protein KatS3mg057_3032 [Herpetosiphonaceae bacterium]
MSLTHREFWMMVHLGLGVMFLHTFFEGILWLHTGERLRRLRIGTGVMALVAWLTVVSGTWLVYPWYRAKPPAGADLADYPRAYLLANPSISQWHIFGMEWKEHVGWLSPILATAVAWTVLRYGGQLARDRRLRQVLLVLFVAAFTTAGIAGALGAFINKVAPNTFLDG